MTLLVLVVIVLPFTLLMASLASDVISFYRQVEEMIKTGQLQAYGRGRRGYKKGGCHSHRAWQLVHKHNAEPSGR
jgi:hypothetical protein